MHYSIEDIDAIEDWWIKKSRINFLAYRMFMRPRQFAHNWFIADLCNHLQRFYLELIAGKRPILLIQSPPQHGKSWSITDFIAWISGREPQLRSIYASYSDTLGIRCNTQLQRFFDTDKHKRIFPKHRIGGVARRNSRLIEYIDANGFPTGGQFRNTTVAGSVTGESLDCVTGDTKIITDIGEISIKDLISIDSPVKVLSFNHKTGRLEFEEITYFKKIKRDGIYRVTDNDGRVLECTENHQIYSEQRGYLTADTLSTCEDNLCVLRKRKNKTCLRNEQVDKNQLPNYLLLKSLSKETLPYSTLCYKILQRLRCSVTKTIWKTVRNMLGKSEGYPNNRSEISPNSKKLPFVRRVIHSRTQRARRICSILFQKMFGKWPLSINERGSESEMGWWDEGVEGITIHCSGLLQSKKRISSGQSKKVQNMWRNRVFALPPYRRESRKQPRIESKISLQRLSFGNSQAIKIEKIKGCVDVYDITVKNNHNFFANGILVHNCGIIDDAVKGREQAGSIALSQKIWEWFTDDFMTRFSDRAGLLVIMTRWTTHDLIARLMDIKDKLPGSFKLLNYQAIATKDGSNRNEGEALFPELKSLSFLEGKKAIMPQSSWESLYQGNPTVSGGNKFKDSWWRWWQVLSPLAYKFITADTAQKTKNENDWTVFQCWGFGIDGRLYLLDKFREKLEAPDLRREAEIFYKKHDTPRLNANDPILRGMYIEDKSSGVGLLQELKRKRMKVIEVPRVTDKIFRAEDASPYIKAGLVVLNTDVPSVDNITKEAREFPKGEFDDDIDTLMTAIEVAFINKDKTSMLAAAMEVD